MDKLICKFRGVKLYRDNFINAFCLSLMIFCDYIINIIIFSLSKKYILNGSLDSDEMTVIQYIVIEGGFNTISSFMKSIWRLRKSIASKQNENTSSISDFSINPRYILHHSH